MSSKPPVDQGRRDALKCLAYGGAGTLFTLSAGVLIPTELALAASSDSKTGVPLFLQISDTHIGFNKPANTDVVATLNRSIDLVNALPAPPIQYALRPQPRFRGGSPAGIR